LAFFNVKVLVVQKRQPAESHIYLLHGQKGHSESAFMLDTVCREGLFQVDSPQLDF
jgi:hypothetical protein